jgi:hypothetical protein
VQTVRDIAYLDHLRHVFSMSHVERMFKRAEAALVPASANHFLRAQAVS